MNHIFLPSSRKHVYGTDKPIATLTLTKVPNVGKVRIIFTGGVVRTQFVDNVIEVNFSDNKAIASLSLEQSLSHVA